MSMEYKYYEGADAAATKEKPTFGYYRQPTGWITASPATNTDELRYRRAGWEPLSAYGFFDMDNAYMANNPFEPLFMRGGAREMCVEQIRAMGFALHPPVIPACKTALGPKHKRHLRPCLVNAVPVEFPQLAGMDIEGFPCSFGCGRDPFPTMEARDQHASVMHAPEKSDERTGVSLAEALAKALVPAMGGREATVDNTMIGALLQKMEAMAAELEAMKASTPKRRQRRPRAAASV